MQNKVYNVSVDHFFENRALFWDEGQIEHFFFTSTFFGKKIFLNNLLQTGLFDHICVQHAGSSHEPTIFAAHLQLFLFDLAILHNMPKTSKTSEEGYVFQHACEMKIDHMCMHDRPHMGGRHYHECVWQDLRQGLQYACVQVLPAFRSCLVRAGVLKTSAPAHMHSIAATCRHAWPCMHGWTSRICFSIGFSWLCTCMRCACGWQHLAGSKT